jgi:hypothetical protein
MWIRAAGHEIRS